MDPRELDVLQLELECKAVVDGDRLVRIPGDEPDDIEGIQVVRYPDGECRFRVRHDIDHELYAKVAALGADTLYEHPETLSASWRRLTSYTFPAMMSAPQGVLEIARESRMSFEVHVDDAVASLCCSSRENDKAAEAWVETEPFHRRRGYARAVVAAWACSVRDAGKVALYTHSEDNVASAAVAASLRLVPWMSYVNIEVGAEE
jgi:GNAT superfamily N-acetyltransferase